MNDEKYVFFQDLKEKKTTGYSAKKQRTHCGKGGRVKFPSDYLTRKELRKMSGECTSYRLNEPMFWHDFVAMPDDIKVTYIKLIRERYAVPDACIAKMLGVNVCTVSEEFIRLGIAKGRGKYNRNAACDKDGFYAWIADTAIKKVMPETPTVIPEENEIATENEAVAKRNKTIPTSGTLSYEGTAGNILLAINDLLGDTNVRLTVNWEVV